MRISIRLLQPVLCVAALAVSAISFAQTSGMRIYGALSNFDCYNDTYDDCEGFEIEIEGMHKEDVVHTWNYSAYGAPTVTTIGTGLTTSALVRYHSPTSIVAVGHFTHFGVTLARFPASGAIHYRWLPKATVVTPNPTPVPVELPIHQSLLNVNTLHESLKNPDHSGRIVWVLPYGNRVSGRGVELEELMTTNPIITDAVPMGSGSDHLRPSKLLPGESWQNDDPPGTDDHSSAVMMFKVYYDVATPDGHGHINHSPGLQFATIMNATVIGSTAPPQPANVYLSDTQVTGTQIVQSMVTLDGEAPAEGTAVSLSSSSPAATVPPTANVLANMDSALFDINTNPVFEPTTVTITATANGLSKAASFVVMPPTLQQVWLAYINAQSGTSFGGAVYLLGPAPVGGMPVALKSDSPYLIVPKVVVVPAGATSATFTVQSKRVRTTTIATLVGTFRFGGSRSTTVRLLP